MQSYVINKTNRSNDATENPLILILYLELQEQMSFRGFYGVFKKFQELSKEFQFLNLGGFKEFQEVSKKFFWGF